jgi:hypothetical protein
MTLAYNFRPDLYDTLKARTVVDGRMDLGMVEKELTLEGSFVLPELAIVKSEGNRWPCLSRGKGQSEFLLVDKKVVKSFRTH